MASFVSSDSGSPPLFKVGTPVNEFASQMCCDVERCPLCNQKTKAFYCIECIRNGNIYHSRMKLPERYADKQLRYTRLRRELKEQQEQLKELHAKKTKHLLLKEKIVEKKYKLELLNGVVEENKKKLKEVRQAASDIGNANAQRNLRLPNFYHNLVKTRKMVEYYRTKIKDRKEKKSKIEAERKQVVREHIKDLTTYIFPITKVDTSTSVSEGDPGDTASAIAEASQTTYVRGRWVYTDISHETRYRIVEPILPGSGDYTGHYLLSIPSITVPRDGDTDDSSSSSDGGRSKAVERRTSGAERLSGAVNVCAALSYLTQFINELAFYLDVTLPKKLCFSEFGTDQNSENSMGRFVRAVNRLNTNMLYLDFSQNVPPSQLHPTHTVSNVLALLDTQHSDLGRLGSFEIAESLVESMEESMAVEDPGVSSEDEEEDDTDTLSSEWETVPKLLPQAEPPSVPTHQAYSTFSSTAVYSQATGGPLGGQGGAGAIMSSAAASVMSLFRGLGAGSPNQK